jgi:hypothetical protein
MSYAVFDDSLASKHFLWYMRKYINGFDDNGVPVQELSQRSASELVNRPSNDEITRHQIDTLGFETTEVPKGKFRALRVKDLLSEGVTQHKGDSTVYYERSEEQVHWYTNAVPLAGVARIDYDNVQRGRTWLAGESKGAEMRTLEHSKGSTVVEDYGSGMKSLLIDPRFQRPLSEQGITEEKPSPPRRPRRAGTKTG